MHEYKSDDLTKRTTDTELRMNQLHAWMDTIDDIKEKDKFFAHAMSIGVARETERRKDDPLLKLEPLTQDIRQAFQKCYGLDHKSAQQEANKIVLKSTKYADLHFSDKVKKLTFDFLEVIENIKLKVLSITTAKAPLEELRDRVSDTSKVHRADNVAQSVIKARQTQKDTHSR